MVTARAAVSPSCMLIMRGHWWLLSSHSPSSGSRLHFLCRLSKQRPVFVAEPWSAQTLVVGVGGAGVGGGALVLLLV